MDSVMEDIREERRGRRRGIERKRSSLRKIETRMGEGERKRRVNDEQKGEK